MKLRSLALIFFSLTGLVSAQLTVHIYNPWIENPYRQDSLFIRGIQEVGYHPGTKMDVEGNGWFRYTIEESFFQNATINFRSYIGNQYDRWDEDVTFPDTSSNGIMLNDDLLDLFPGYDEFWIIPVDSLSTYNVYIEPPDGKVIHFMNPWPENSPQILVGGNPARKMRFHTQHCGWYTYFYSGFIDSLQNVRFTDYYHTEQYGATGLSGGSAIDLSTYLAENDTVYILPRPYPSGAPSITHAFPGRTGDCPTREISALVRDWAFDGVSFFDAGHGGELTIGMVDGRLGENGKPVTGANAREGDGTRLESWFITEDNNETCVDLTLTKGYDGLWEYDSDIFGGFFPIDDFNHPNNLKYLDSDSIPRNFHFTMEMHLQFVYHAGSGQIFKFRGDDDVWIFVNNRLAIDLGGMHMPEEESLDMDLLAPKLGLEDKGNYAMDIFFAERQPVNSNFLIRTSLNLRNSADLFYDDFLLDVGKTQYDIMQIVGTQGLDCGFTPLMNEEEPADVYFYLDGPQFSERQGPLALDSTHFGGITLDSSTATIDSSAISGLAAGEYTLTFESIYDSTRQGYILFTVAGKLPATLYATPPGGTHFIQDTLVSLTTDEGARIYFTIDGTEPDTTDETQLYTDPVLINKTITINAVAVGDDYLPTSRSYSYTRDALPISLTANPPDNTHFFEDTTVILSAQPDARIYYTTDGTAPDTSNPEHLYTQPLILNQTTTVTALAIGDYLVTATGTWTYLRDLPHASLEAQPGDGTHFGQELVITLLTNADAVYFTVDGTEPVADDENQLYTSPFTIAGDTVTVRAIAIGTEFNSTSKQFTYIRDKVSDIQANPPGREFSENITVNLFVSDVDAIIYYTIDGTEPTQNSIRYEDALEFTSTTQLRARAFAPDKLPSNILTETYTRASVALEAFYYDRDADGGIDCLWVALDYKAQRIPDSLLLRNPFSGSENITLLGDGGGIVTAQDGMSLSAVWEPGFIFKNYTGFSPNYYARFNSRTYDTKDFTVQDRVAPVITSATYAPNLLTENMQVIGKLTVTFSEEIVPLQSDKPFRFYQGEVNYSLELKRTAQSDNMATFDVYSIDGVEFMQTGDLIRINSEEGVSDLLGNIQDNPDNREVALKVLDQEYKLTFKAGPNPFIPDVSQPYRTIGDLTINKGTAIVADFSGNLGSRASRISAQVSIYDCLSNLVCEASLRGASDSHVQFDVVTENSTKIYFLWDGYNRNGRKVGNGTYMAVVTVTDPSNDTVTKKIPIGVTDQ